MAAAERGVWTATQLRRLLAERARVEMSAASVSVLFTKQAAQVKLSTLTALCTALDCTPGDLLALPAAEPPVPLPPPPKRSPVESVLPPEPRHPARERQAGTARRSLPPL
ncbi:MULTISPECIES: helix-turn-helix domain-containing protein [Kitasatospora]|uniref:Helix-turn-helix transcriptional regulator n=1 Tax=Kitasatospora cathayae TaxID=3004092 RepID=A0ABY7QEY3_9ACTN|nr:helix-turn-helix transcriptional regulator [Kitasatospora sp. HUAS 3-15]WBP91307.1 helix-turn-helix transcriptional regulator [Kitasatospora sp. HUAS 3-15]